MTPLFRNLSIGHKLTAFALVTSCLVLALASSAFVVIDIVMYRQSMVQEMKAISEIPFDGVIIPDHIPLMADDPKVGTAFSIGYMRALLDRALEEGEARIRNPHRMRHQMLKA